MSDWCASLRFPPLVVLEVLNDERFILAGILRARLPLHHLAVDVVSLLPPGEIQLIILFEVQPELGFSSEIPAQPEGCIGGNCSLALDDC